MQSSAFHAFLRHQPVGCSDFQRDIVGNAKLWSDFRYNELRCEALGEFLADKRRAFLKSYRKSKEINLDLPEITVEDVQHFIHFNEDRLQSNLEALQDRLTEIHRVRNNKMCRHLSPQERLSLPRLYLLFSISAEDVFTLLVRFGGIVRAQNARILAAAVDQESSRLAGEAQQEFAANESTIQSRRNNQTVGRERHKTIPNPAKNDGNQSSSAPSFPVRSQRSPSVLSPHRVNVQVRK
jgi:hypothetical protein